MVAAVRSEIGNGEAANGEFNMAIIRAMSSFDRIVGLVGHDPCSDDERILGRYGYSVQLVVAFFQRGNSQFSEGAGDPRNRNLLLPPR
jgi:hypothetical protein